MKSICIVVQNFYDLDIRVRRKAEALVAAGYSVDVLALRGADTPKHYTLGGVNVSTISLGKKRGSLLRYAFEYGIFLLWAFFRLTFDMRRRHYAVVDINTLPDFLVFAGLFAQRQGAQLVLDMHEITPEFYMSKYEIAENSWLIGLLKWQERASFRFADRVITINEPIEDLLCGRGLEREKSTIIMNSADEANFAVNNSASADAAAATPASFRMIYHGTLTRLYGLDIAVEAFAIAQKDMPGAEFWILGGGPEAPLLARMVKERALESQVKLLGMVKPAEIPAYLSKCDVGVLPIRRDIFLDFAFPNKLAEFIVMGNAVIISRLKAIRHSFSDDALAFAEPNDPADLARQMVRLYRDNELRRHLVANARKEYAPIRWEVMKERYLRLIAELAKVPTEVVTAGAAATSAVR